MGDDQFDFDKAQVDPLDGSKPYNDPANREWMRRRMEQTMFRGGMDPIQARKESMETINFLVWQESDDFKMAENEGEVLQRAGAAGEG